MVGRRRGWSFFGVEAVREWGRFPSRCRHGIDIENVGEWRECECNGVSTVSIRLFCGAPGGT